MRHFFTSVAPGFALRAHILTPEESFRFLQSSAEADGEDALSNVLTRGEAPLWSETEENLSDNMQ